MIFNTILADYFYKKGYANTIILAIIITIDSIVLLLLYFSVFYKPQAFLSNGFVLLIIAFLTSQNFNKLKRYLNEKQA
jgi:hypothetical protein